MQDDEPHFVTIYNNLKCQLKPTYELVIRVYQRLSL